MVFVEWSEKLSVGMPEIDDQHKELISILNRLHAAMSEGKGKVVLKDTLADLADYTVTHFYTEERYMARYRYPKLAEHKAEHEAFVSKVKKFQLDFEAGNATMSIDLMKFIKDWLVTHITGTDMQMGAVITGAAK
jgi:hemerythrin